MPSAVTARTQILLVDDHTIFRWGVRRLVADEPDLVVACEASSGAEGLMELRKGRYDLLLLDINLEGRSGLEMLNSVRGFSAIPVLMLSMYPEEQYALVAIQQGANGYIAKDAQPGELVSAIRKVACGEQYLSAGAAQHVAAQLSGHDQRLPHQRLSHREYQILLMLIKGRTLTEIGKEMMISIKTVSTHKVHILEKLGVATTADLVLYAVRTGLLD